MNRQAAVWFSAVIVSAACGSTAAHHSYAEFDRCKSVSMEGQIEYLTWANPHIRITLKTADPDAYQIEWFDLQGLTRAGISTDSLNIGDRVVVTGSPSRDPNLRVVTLLTQIRRPSDGWSWIRPSPVNAPGHCSAE